MATKKPIYIDETTGRYKRIRSSESLPNQPDIQELQNLLTLLVAELIDEGFEFKSEKLIMLLDRFEA